MSDKPFGLAKKSETLSASLGEDEGLCLTWLPHYVSQFPSAMQNISLEWEKCKFVKAAKDIIPQEHGVYCFSTMLGSPFPEDIHLILYIGKAAPKYLCERFNDYFQEKDAKNGRRNIINMLTEYHGRLFFCWSALPRLYVDTVEEHLLMCCKPPFNEKIPSRKRLWSNAFQKSH